MTGAWQRCVRVPGCERKSGNDGGVSRKPEWWVAAGASGTCLAFVATWRATWFHADRRFHFHAASPGIRSLGRIAKRSLDWYDCHTMCFMINCSQSTRDSASTSSRFEALEHSCNDIRQSAVLTGYLPWKCRHDVNCSLPLPRGQFGRTCCRRETQSRCSQIKELGSCQPGMVC
jgi:hypothetical protein